MHILHCNTYDEGGGATIAARRIHAALLAQDVHSRFGVLKRTQADLPVSILSGKWRRLLDPVLQTLEQASISCLGAKPSSPFSPALLPTLVHRLINSEDADIVHLHWIASAFISPFSLRRIKKPVVWTLHDTWGFTGGCHVLQGCEQYKTSCAACPHMSLRAQAIIRKSFSAKKKAYYALRPVMVSPSKAYAQRITESTLLGQCECHHIPNPIDTEIYKPIDKALARHVLGVPAEERVVAFGAMSALSDRNKGFDLLVKALEIVFAQHKKNMRVLVFGAALDSGELSRYPVHCLGHLHDEISLRLAYCAADIFVCPSREECFSLTTQESLACGTPVAAFAVGGIPDMIEHGVNGMLASPHDPAELAHGILYLLADDMRRAQMGRAARAAMEERFAMPIIAQQYIKLYEDVLEQRRLR